MTTRRGFLATSSMALLWSGGLRAQTSQVVVNANAYNLRTARQALRHIACRTTAQVQQALRAAQAGGQGFAIRSSGHCFEGFSQHDAIQIDVSGLNEVRWDGPDHIVAGAGATLGAVNQLTGPQGRMLPAGFCQGVALGGHVTGGGLGFYARRFGLACDHLRAATIVLADGQAVETSTQNHPDLFWALRGGGAGSFGIVTQMRLAVRPVPEATLLRFWWQGSAAEMAQVTADWHALSQGLPAGFGATLNAIAQPGGLIRLQLLVLTTEPPGIARGQAARIFALAPGDGDPHILVGPPHAIADSIWPRQPDVPRPTKVLSDYLTGPADPARWQAAYEAVLSQPSGNITLILDLMGGAVDDPAPTDTAYPHRGAGDMMMQYILDLDPAQDSAPQIAHLRRIRALFEGVASGGVYVNYPDRDMIDYPTRYWGANLERLKQIKARYDPSDVFQHPGSVPLPV